MERSTSQVPMSHREKTNDHHLFWQRYAETNSTYTYLHEHVYDHSHTHPHAYEHVFAHAALITVFGVVMIGQALVSAGIFSFPL